MDVVEFIKKYALAPEEIHGAACVAELMAQMARGLAGEGNIPMIPSYLPVDIRPEPGVPCCVLDAGGTNLRTARAVFDEAGNCDISGLSKGPMLGAGDTLSFGEFYGQLARLVRGTGQARRVGLCFSYNVEQERTLDGRLMAWCKEIRVPEAVGKPVGASLKAALGENCQSVHVLNDSVAALLGAHFRDPRISLGVILGTGINICYSEACRRIPKLPGDLKGETMVISTEIGEFSGIPKTVFDEAVIAASDDPRLAQAEKQCAGAYLGGILSGAWQQAVREGVLDAGFDRQVTLAQVSGWLAGEADLLPASADAEAIARTVIARAAKIAAILTAGVVLFSHGPGSRCTMVIEGSQYEKLTGFAEAFRRELEELLTPRAIDFDIVATEDSCLTGAALAAFAQPM